LAQLVCIGDRVSVIEEANVMMRSAVPFIKIGVGLLFPLLGYRIEQLRAEFPAIHDGIYDAIDSKTLTVATFNAALELGARLYAPGFIAAALAEAKKSTIDRKTVAGLYSGYRAQSYGLPHVVARTMNRVTQLAGRVAR
jgi:hypothetical protein